MTREEAIAILKVIEWNRCCGEERQALEIGIEALSAPVCEDNISRKEVIKFIAEFVNNEYATEEDCEFVNLIIGGIKSMPNSTPARKRAKCGDCENFGTTNCSETYREPTIDDEACECFCGAKNGE